MQRWEFSLPLIQNFNNQYQEGYIEQQTDAGVPFRRLKFSDVKDIVNFNVSLTREQYLRFLSWYRLDIRQGSIPFIMQDCRMGVERVARIIGNPQFATNSNRYEVSLTVAYDTVNIFDNYNLVANEEDTLVVTINGQDYGLEVSTQRAY